MGMTDERRDGEGNGTAATISAPISGYRHTRANSSGVNGPDFASRWSGTPSLPTS
jgi:hypothetical protein